MFRNVRAVALHAMANRALSLLLTAVPLDQRTALAEQVAMMDDDELLQALTRSNSDECRYLAQRIRGADPYACVGKWSNVVVNANKPRLEKVALEIARREGILLYADPGFWRRGTASPTRDWLDTGAIIVDETGRPLTEHPEQRADFAHLREAGQVQYLWAFHQDEGGVPHALRDALRGED